MARADTILRLLCRLERAVQPEIAGNFPSDNVMRCHATKTESALKVLHCQQPYFVK